MSKRGDKNRDIKLRGQFIPAFVETRRTPAWKALSMGARELYMALKGHHFVGFNNNNGRIFLSERDAMEEMGATNRKSIRRWFRELEHFGFIVKTAEHHLGVDGKGKAAQWRLTELETPLADSKEATLDYKRWDGTPFNGNQAWRGRGQKPKKQNPGGERTSRVGAKQPPVLGAKQPPPNQWSGGETTSISAPQSGGETTSISRLTTGGGVGGSLMKQKEGKLPWSKPTLVAVPGDRELDNPKLHEEWGLPALSALPASQMAGRSSAPPQRILTLQECKGGDPLEAPTAPLQDAHPSSLQGDRNREAVRARNREALQRFEQQQRQRQRR